MKRILPFTLFLLSSTYCLKAEILPPAYTYSEDFKSAIAEDKLLPDGWVSYGIGEPVESSYQQYFGSEGAAPFFRVFNLDGKCAAWSCSTFIYANTADEWLVSPPIHISSDKEMLRLNALTWGDYNTNRYRVLISESGQAKENFQKSPILNTTLAGMGNEIRTKESFVTISGYAGKDICLAFVNKSDDGALLGFNNIALAPYFIDVENLTPAVMQAGQSAKISVNVNIRTASEAEGIKAELICGDKTITKTYNDKINASGTRILVDFEDISVPEGGLDYSILITPLFDGAKSTEVIGKIGTPTTSYPPVAVVEEFTGTWCTYCPRGAAFMNYYADTYTGKDGKMKMVGIALHTAQDPMQMQDPAYFNTAYETSKAKGYPSAFFNRKTLGDPSDAEILKEMEGTRTYSRIKINKVEYAPDADIKVSYEVENSYAKRSLNQRVALVMVENDVKGDNALYRQSNGLSGVSKQAVINTYGEELWPYIQFFAEQPNPVPYQLMTYEHVARGIWPDYYGTLLNMSCEAEVPISNDMVINMPEQVMDPQHTAIIALLMDADTGEIISADEVEAEDYNKSNLGVEDIESDSLTLSLQDGILTVASSQSGKVNVISVAGERLVSSDFSEGTSTFNLSALSGMIIVEAVTRHGDVRTAKFVQ